MTYACCCRYNIKVMREKDTIRRKRREKQSQRETSFPPDNPALSVEKQKARDLRHSSWWRNKKSSGICYYCKKKFDPDDLTMDHLIPVSRGGKSEKINLVPACKECNNKKKYLLPGEWEEYLHRILHS